MNLSAVSHLSLSIHSSGFLVSLKKRGFNLAEVDFFQMQQHHEVIHQVGGFIHEAFIICVFCFDDKLHSFLANFLRNLVDAFW